MTKIMADCGMIFLAIGWQIWFTVGVARQPNMPNPENCSLAELEVAARAAPRQRGYVRSIAIKALLFGYSHEQVSGLYSVSRRTLSRWVTWFNERGIDGLLDRPRTGRPRKIGPEKSKKYRELIQHPDKANEIHWTAKKFHGYVTKQLQDDIGYRTLLRWLHEEGFRLKVPQPWPNGQDEEKRQAFIEQLKTYLKDPEIEIWYLDETGIEGDPRPRRRWAQKGEKIRQPYEGTHIRIPKSFKPFSIRLIRTSDLSEREIFSFVTTPLGTSVPQLTGDDLNASFFHPIHRISIPLRSSGLS